jgi:hypothetical protein
MTPEMTPDAQLDAATLPDFRTLPDFLIIGAMKCGTTTLQAQLALQPGVFMTTPKEPNFFSDDEVYARGLSWYRGLFDAAPPGALKGEASTHYTKLPTHPHTMERLRPTLRPDLKLIYMIRNPVERAVSQFIHEWTMGQMAGTAEEAFRDHPELEAYGHYPMQLAPWIEAYGREAVLVTSLEAMTADPQGVLTKVARHLGLAGATWAPEKARENVSAERSKRLPLQGLLVDNAVATALRRTLVPKSWRERIRKGRQMTDRPDLTPWLKNDLEERFAPDLALLETLFPGNPDIAAADPFVTRS